MFDRERVVDWMTEVRKNLRRLHSLAEMCLEDFSADADNFAIAEHHLRRSKRLVHLYHDVTTKELHEIISTRLPDIEEFCQHILRYMNELV